MEVHMKSPSCRRASVEIALAAIAFVLTISCSSGSGSPEGGSGSFPIVDDPLHGVIVGDTFSFVDGGAAKPGTGEGTDYSFMLYNEERGEYFDPWEWGGYTSSTLSVSFEIPLVVGTYPLYNNYDGSKPRTVTLLNRNNSTFLPADEGSIRIDTIDIGAHAVTGAIAARGSHNHDVWVNGDFTVQYEP
jgi:hypothetical protein